MSAEPSTVIPKTARGAATRTRLLEAARREIIEHQGEMDFASVASRARVSPGLPYRYFESKSALLVAVVDSFFDALDETVYRPVFEEVSSDWWCREQARIEKLVDFFYEEPLGPFIVSQLAGDGSVLAAKHRRVARQVRGASANVKTGKALGRVPACIDEELAGALLIGGVHQSIDMALGRRPPMPRRRVTLELQTFMKNVLQIED